MPASARGYRPVSRRLLRAELSHQGVHLRLTGLVQCAAQRYLRFAQSEILKGKLEGKGARVTLCDLTVTDLSYAVTSAFYCGKLVLVSSTYDGGLFPPMKAFLEHLQAKGFRSRRVGLMENGSWAPAAARLMRAELEKMKDLRLCETEVSLRGALNQTSEAQMDALVAELCAE